MENKKIVKDFIIDNYKENCLTLKKENFPQLTLKEYNNVIKELSREKFLVIQQRSYESCMGTNLFFEFVVRLKI